MCVLILTLEYRKKFKIRNVKASNVNKTLKPLPFTQKVWEHEAEKYESKSRKIVKGLYSLISRNWSSEKNLAQHNTT